MATHARPSGTLLQNISQASIAARDFGIACKRGLNGLVDQNATQDASLLSEDELRAWRESSERKFRVFLLKRLYYTRPMRRNVASGSRVAANDSVSAEEGSACELELFCLTQYPQTP